MEKDKRRLELDSIFENIDESQKKLVDKLLDEVVFLEIRMEELKKMPFVKVHPEDPSRQKTTSAAKLYKECSQSYMNAIRILCGLLNKVETTAQDELIRILQDI